MDTTGSLFVLGSFVVACCARTARLPRPGESLVATSFSVEAGGKGLNVAIGAHRLGVEIDGIFAIGNDFFSQLAHATFRDAGLSAEMLITVPGATGSGIGFTDRAGENCLAVFPGANAELSAGHVGERRHRIETAALTVAQFEVPEAAIRAAFAIARAAGRETLLNPSPYRALSPELLGLVGTLVVNRIEAASLAADLGIEVAEEREDGYDDLARGLLARGPDVVVVTLGQEGSVAYTTGAGRLRQPACPVDAVDTLGAGDAFLAGYVAARLEGRTTSECLAWGAACGAIVCKGDGVLSRLPGRNELGRLLDARAL